MKTDEKEFIQMIDWIKNMNEEDLAKLKDYLENPVRYQKKKCWSIMDERMYGKLIKDFGNFKADFFYERNVFLTKKDNRYEIVIKSTNIGDFNSDPDYKFFSIDEAQKLRDIFDDAIKISNANHLKNIE